MTLMVVLWSYGILKVLDPSPSEPLYIFYDGTCELSNGAITVKIEDLLPPEPTDPVGTLTQDGRTCNVEELVYPGI
jgi:hypothetical protein